MAATEPGSTPTPVQLEVQPPAAYDIKQLLLRVLLCVGVALLHQSWGRLLFALYLLLPAVAFVLLARSGSAGLTGRDRAGLERFVSWVVGLYGFMLFVSDRFPLDAETRAVRLELHEQGRATSGAALMRLLTGVPYALFLALMLIVSVVLALWIALCVLMGRPVAPGAYAFQRDMLARLAHLFAYLASLVDSAPSIGFGTDGPRSPNGDQQQT